ncbi:MAG: hypothetical protein GXP29_15135 [Planctomycetes bacterium]|nr:hypothetical protein [Planctomycetota bacterium]
MPKFLFKANDDGISHCQCAEEPAMSTGQLDCPWCGCGWLIPCSACKRSFTYAVIREIDEPLVEVGRREVAARGLNDIPEQDIIDWAEAMGDDLDRFKIGQIVVYLDGEYLELDSRNVSFDGYFAHHEFKTLPHADALERPEVLDKTLGARSYWLERKLPEQD